MQNLNTNNSSNNELFLSVRSGSKYAQEQNK